MKGERRPLSVESRWTGLGPGWVTRGMPRAIYHSFGLSIWKSTDPATSAISFLGRGWVLLGRFLQGLSFGMEKIPRALSICQNWPANRWDERGRRFCVGTTAELIGLHSTQLVTFFETESFSPEVVHSSTEQTRSVCEWTHFPVGQFWKMECAASLVE